MVALCLYFNEIYDSVVAKQSNSLAEWIHLDLFYALFLPLELKKLLV